MQQNGNPSSELALPQRSFDDLEALLRILPSFFEGDIS